jgi:hypothetical protein
MDIGLEIIMCMVIDNSHIDTDIIGRIRSKEAAMPGLARCYLGFVVVTLVSAATAAKAQDEWREPEPYIQEDERQERAALLWDCLRHEFGAVMHEPAAVIRIEIGEAPNEFVIVSTYRKPRTIAMLWKDDFGFHARGQATSFARTVSGLGWDRTKEALRRSEALRRANECFAIANTKNIADARFTIRDRITYLPLPPSVRDFLSELRSSAIKRLSEKDCTYPQQFQFHGETLWAFPNRDIGNRTEVNVDVLDASGPGGRVLSTFVVRNAEIRGCGLP